MEDQCPRRGPGLTHVFDDGVVCDSCGYVQGRALTLAEWLARYLGFAKPEPPTKLIASGEPVEADKPVERLAGAFSALPLNVQIALNVERAYHERHQCDDRL